MKISMKLLPSFMREAKRLKKRYVSFVDDYARLIEELKSNPSGGVDFGGGLRKVRMWIFRAEDSRTIEKQRIVVNFLVDGRRVNEVG